jgi:translation initiation factor 2 subunit 3
MTKQDKAGTSKHEALQPEVTIGLFGHVDHGKTTLTEQLSGKWTDTHSEELKRGITIRLGYADSVFYKCPKCKGYEAYSAKRACKCGEHGIPLRKLSFVDAPGHESLMATMLSGATMIDGALLLVAANEKCPQPQTKEHLMALQIMGVKSVVVVQNKIDLVSEDEAIESYEQIKRFLALTEYKDSPIVPVSAQFGINIGFLIEAIEANIPTRERDANKEPSFLVARSFDINRPGTPLQELQGGVLGGSLVQGRLKPGMMIEIRPGQKQERDGRVSFKPILTKIFSLRGGGENLQEATPGGSLGVQTLLDPSIVSSDRLAGSVVGIPDKLPPVHYELELETKLLKRVVGAKDKLVVEPLRENEYLMLNVNTAATVGLVTELSKDHVKCKLKLPVCAALGSRVTISRMVANRWRLIGYGLIS